MAALRRLRVQAMLITDEDGLRIFREKIAATSTLADQLGLGSASATLAEMHRGLSLVSDFSKLPERVERQIQALETDVSRL